ncbi:MAG: OmpA family protein, partial [Muribaculaceae bacterium]|nr:OmpA family protein [Muribaculaceae bacterium]
MANKIRVYGKAQNRTSLGIMHAYMVMYPHATIEDLRKAFPNELAPDNGTGQIFIFADQKGTTANWDGYFKSDDELLTTGDG